MSRNIVKPKIEMDLHGKSTSFVSPSRLQRLRDESQTQTPIWIDQHA
jgi:hypothetical protein